MCTRSRSKYMRARGGVPRHAGRAMKAGLFFATTTTCICVRRVYRLAMSLPSPASIEVVHGFLRSSRDRPVASTTSPPGARRLFVCSIFNDVTFIKLSESASFMPSQTFHIVRDRTKRQARQLYRNTFALRNIMPTCLDADEKSTVVWAHELINMYNSVRFSASDPAAAIRIRIAMLKCQLKCTYELYVHNARAMRNRAL